jgi:hypothetical protein
LGFQRWESYGSLGLLAQAVTFCALGAKNRSFQTVNTAIGSYQSSAAENRLLDDM